MKPTKVRNQQIYRASNQTRNKQICAPLSKDLRKKYSRRSARIVTDDNIKIIRGEYKGLTGKVTKISIDTSSVALEGNKKEKSKGEKVDVFIHSSNVIITSDGELKGTDIKGPVSIEAAEKWPRIANLASMVV